MIIDNFAFIDDPSILKNIFKENIFKSKEIKIMVAYLKDSGLKIIEDSLLRVTKSGTNLKIITCFDFGLTEPLAMKKLLLLENTSIKIFDNPTINFHPKIYIFRKQDTDTIILGSSNLTGGAFNNNVELNVVFDIKNDLEFDKVFERFWNSQFSKQLTKEVIERYIESREKIFNKTLTINKEYELKEYEEFLRKAVKIHEPIVLYDKEQKGSNKKETKNKKGTVLDGLFNEIGIHSKSQFLIPRMRTIGKRHKRRIYGGEYLNFQIMFNKKDAMLNKLKAEPKINQDKIRRLNNSFIPYLIKRLKLNVLERNYLAKYLLHDRLRKIKEEVSVNIKDEFERTRQINLRKKALIKEIKKEVFLDEVKYHRIGRGLIKF